MSNHSIINSPRVNEDPDDDNDFEDWIDHANTFCIEVLNWHNKPQQSIYEHPSLIALCLTTETMLDGNANQETVQLVPRSDKVCWKDQEIADVRQYLASPELALPLAIPKDKVGNFLDKASEFFYKNSQLWCCNAVKVAFVSSCFHSMSLTQVT